ncbi:aspartate/glutamate racemase family protein [Alteraurantiacibacter aquimixticola]|uniref:Amino acid racemase n=1 Tax=Alteraurantiacibacter aquimixticola TaxID=2489173 RepID=A0A4T3F3I7_9SPHN|nr:amino acid racemase [Alteraurantiacibacter aquimixticola]TIX51826.1 amino acid racemase [Alteraurantiacibacter aquimixticola]
MHKLGLIGGMSWVSTRSYYEQINRIVQKTKGGHASAPMIIENLDFTALSRLETDKDWEGAAAILIASAKRLEQAGAEVLVIAANSMHRVYREIEAEVGIPMLHVAECVGEAMAADGVTKAAIIGPKNVMTGGFYRRRLVSHGIDLLPPEMVNVEAVDRIIYDELVMGRATRNAERVLKTMITEKGQEGAQAIVLASTELEMVVDVDANVLPIYDSTRIHARRAAEWILHGK